MDKNKSYLDNIVSNLNIIKIEPVYTKEKNNDYANSVDNNIFKDKYPTKKTIFGKIKYV